jgi:hypothetical protein
MSYPGQFDVLCARAAEQVANLALNDHAEYNTFSRRGTRMNMTTGAGQANGIFTFTAGMVYQIAFGVRALITAGAAGIAQFTLRTNPGAANVLDDNGQPMTVTVTSAQGATDVTSMASGIWTRTFAADTTCSVDISLLTGATITQINTMTWFYAKAIRLPGG